MTALLILAGYAMAIRLGWIPATDGFQVRDKNRIKSERYVLDSGIRPAAVLIGSSLTANLPTPEISTDVFNLGLAGESVWTGLELIRGRPDFRPRVLVLEVSDLLLRPSDHEFTNAVLNPRQVALQKALPMFRTEYQPAGVLLKEIGRWQKRRLAQSAGDAKPSGVLPVTDRLIEKAKRSAEAGVDAGEAIRLKEACAKLRDCIDHLEKEGTRCVLLDVPGDATLSDTPRSRQLAALFDQEFPASRFAWIHPEADFKCKTWDAIHLVQADALIYARYLCHNLAAGALAPRIDREGP